MHVHDLAARILRKNCYGDIPQPTGLHRDLLRLNPEPGAVRIVTTNFDLLFSDAARDVFSEQLELFRAPALPLGRAFNGIVHVHGCLDRPHDMVLTDADFGRAYLTEGWARRSLVELFRSFTVMFVGYSHNDTVMKYLARAPPARESQPRFAITDNPGGDHWPVLGIEPISYPQDSKDDHRRQNEGIRSLADYTRRGLLDWRHEITEIARRPPSLDEREADIIVEALADVTRAQFFADAAMDPDWLDWLDRRGHLAPLFGAADLPRPHMRLADWMVDRFVFDHPETLFRLIARHSMHLNPQFWYELAQAIASRTDRPLSDESLSRWVSCLLANIPPRPDMYQLLYLALRCIRTDLVAPSVEIFDAMAGHGLSLRPPFPEFDDELADQLDFPGEDVDVVLTPEEDDGAFRELWETGLGSRLDTVAEPLLSVAVARLAARHRTLFAWQKADPAWDPENFTRHAIEPHERDHGCDHVDVLIDAARDCLEWLASNRPEAAAGWCGQLARSETPLLRRLSVHALSARNDLAASEKLDWLFANVDLRDVAAHHELFRIMRELYPQADPEQRERAIDIIHAFRWPDDDEEQKTRLAARHRFDWLHWLHDADPACVRVRQALDDIRTRYSEFTPQDHPGLTHWSYPRFGPEHPWSIEELRSRPACEWLDDLLSFCPESPLGPDRRDAIAAVAAAAKRDFRWGAGLADALADRDRWYSDLWIALFRAWREAGLDDDQLSEVFGYLGVPRLSRAHADRVADLLLAWLETPDAPITGGRMAQANAIAARLWELIDRETVPEFCDSWHSAAIGRPTGTLAQYWLRQRSLLRERPDSLPNTLLADIAVALTGVAEDPSVPGLQGRAVLAGQLAFLLDAEEVWTWEHLIPRFTQHPRTEDYQAVWDGFLSHGHFTPLVGECLKDAFLKAVPLIPVHFASGWKLDRFVDFWTLMLAFVADDPAGVWIPSFFEHAGNTAQLRFARQIGRHLRHLDGTRQREWWARWIECYWTRRLDGVPRPLDEAEARLMFAWLPTLKSLFPAAVELALRMPPVPVRTSGTIHDIHRGSHRHDFPETTAKLILHLGQQASPDSAWHHGRELIATLLSSTDLPDGLRKPLLELAARLGPA